MSVKTAPVAGPGGTDRGLHTREAAQRIRKIAREHHPDIAPTPHARQRMQLRGVGLEDIIFALKGCWVVGMTRVGGRWRYQAFGKDLDNRTIRVVVELEEESVIRVITVMTSEDRR